MTTILLALIYICFISLGLPDSLLGSAWPIMHTELGVPGSYAGIVSTLIFVGTVISSLSSGWLNEKFGAGRVTAVSVLLTAVGLFGFSVSDSFIALCLWSLPYGLGAGGVDAILNSYVALHYKPQHMSWLHCMWGVGAAISPYIMSTALMRPEGWSGGYLAVSVIQGVLAIFLLLSLPLWGRATKGVEGDASEQVGKPLGLVDVFRTRGAAFCLLTFFLYCALELTTSLWASSYLTERWDISPEVAAGLGSLFYIGITLGRLLNGFLAIRLSDRTLIRGGLGIIALGVLLLITEAHQTAAFLGLALIGLGCAPVYPCLIHMTPEVFGKEAARSMIGAEMAFAYVGFIAMPPLLGVLAESTSMRLYPPYLLILLLALIILHELVIASRK